MSVEFPDPEEKARSVEYYLRCRVHVKDISYEDVQSKGVVGLVTEEMVFLEPLEGTQRDLFYSAWLPEFEQDHITKEIVPGYTEVTCKAGHPIYGYFKCSVHRRDERFPTSPYMFVMTKSAEEDLKMLRGKELVLTVLSQNDEDLGDYMKDHDLTGKKDVVTDMDAMAVRPDGV